MLLLNEASIRSILDLKSTSFKKIAFYIFPTINSTNQFLKELTNPDSLTICCAETQTNGRGRQNRSWISPFGENIYCSSLWQLKCKLSQLSGLSLVAGLAIVNCLKEICPDLDLKLKWPNDIFWQNKKLGGILIETTQNIENYNFANNQKEEMGSETNGKKRIKSSIIIGIGLNINTATHLQPLDDREKPWCSLYEITGCSFDRNLILGNLIYKLDKYIHQFLHLGFAGFVTEWEKVDFLYGKSVVSSQGIKTIMGKACGVNQLGQLSIKDEQGQFHFLTSGDTSVRYA